MAEQTRALPLPASLPMPDANLETYASFKDLPDEVGCCSRWLRWLPRGGRCRYQKKAATLHTRPFT